MACPGWSKSVTGRTGDSDSTHTSLLPSPAKSETNNGSAPFDTRPSPPAMTVYVSPEPTRNARIAMCEGSTRLAKAASGVAGVRRAGSAPSFQTGVEEARHALLRNVRGRVGLNGFDQLAGRKLQHPPAVFQFPPALAEGGTKDQPLAVRQRVAQAFRVAAPPGGDARQERLFAQQRPAQGRQKRHECRRLDQPAAERVGDGDVAGPRRFDQPGGAARGVFPQVQRVAVFRVRPRRITFTGSSPASVLSMTRLLRTARSSP